MKDDLLVAYQSGFQDGRSMVERECNEVRKQRDALREALRQISWTRHDQVGYASLTDQCALSRIYAWADEALAALGET